jgi:hypothetical protein
MKFWVVRDFRTTQIIKIIIQIEAKDP